MGNIATRLDEQIEILRGRGMEFDIEELKVKEILGDIGYYRLGFYWNPFQSNIEHNFKESTKFSTVITLYYLDCDLRSILSRYINRIEIHFRTQVVYHGSNNHKNSPTWFADTNCVKREFVTKFATIYTDDFKRKNKAIKYHHQKYMNDRFAPAWKTLEFLTFGAIFRLYKNLKNESLKKTIANAFGIIDVSKFESLIESVIYLRNACAHGNVLFDLEYPKGIPSLPFLSVNNSQRHQLYTGIRVVSYFLGIISTNRKREFDNEICKRLTESPDKSVSKIVQEKIGYI